MGGVTEGYKTKRFDTFLSMRYIHLINQCKEDEKLTMINGVPAIVKKEDYCSLVEKIWNKVCGTIRGKA